MMDAYVFGACRSNLKEYIELTRDLLGINDKPSAFTGTSSKRKQDNVAHMCIHCLCKPAGLLPPKKHVHALTHRRLVAAQSFKSVQVGQYVQASNPAEGGNFANAVVKDAPAGAATCTISFLGSKNTDTVQVWS
jgi:hypothetical protein